MPLPKKASKTAKNSSANLGFEAKLWLAADKLRNNMDAAEYKHVVLGLIFLKYISDTFEEHRSKLLAGEGDYEGADPEDPDEPSGARQTATGSPKGERGGVNQYKAENVFWVPSDARWSHLQAKAKAKAKEPSIGKTVDDAMVALERDNIRLKGVLPKDYARPGLDKHRLGELIDLIATIDLLASNQPSPPAPLPKVEGSSSSLPLPVGEGWGEGRSTTHRSVDLLGRVYEYFLTRFASAEGMNGGQFYTPSCVVRCLVEMLAPYKGRIYDPACGSGGSLPARRPCGVRFAERKRVTAQGIVQSEKFVESHGGTAPRDSASFQSEDTLRSLSAAKGNRGDISIYGQESNTTPRRLAVMNLAIRGIEADIGKEHADTFRAVQHPDLRADYVLANPPFNDSDWHRKDDDVRWKYGVPPKGNANFARVQHFIHHLAPDGMAGFVLANGSMSSNQSGEGEIRKALIEADLVDCMVALPGQLFYSTQIPVCLWFIARDKSGGQPSPRPSPTGRGSNSADPPSTSGRGAGGEGRLRDRRGETLFIDARKMGTLIDRVHRELTDEDLEKITSTYHAWRGDSKISNPKSSIVNYEDIPGFCKSATTAEIAAHGHVLTPGRYVGAEEIEDDGDPFEEKMPRLVAELHAQFTESAKLETAIRKNLQGLGFQ